MAKGFADYRQPGLNLIANAAAFIIKALQGILLTPFLVSCLGIERYGLIGLAVSLTGYMGLVSAPVISGLARYLTMDLRRKDYHAANAIFNASLLVCLKGAGLLLALSVIASLNLRNIVELPQDSDGQAKLMFLGVFVSFVVGAVGNVFSVSAYAINRLDLLSYADILHVTVRFALIAVMFTLGKAELGLVGVAYVAASLIAGLSAIYIWKRFTPFLKINLRCVKTHILKQVASFSGWVGVDQFGTLLLLNGELVVANRFLGPAAGGEYAMLLQWSAMLWSVSAVFCNLITPVIYSHYAMGHQDRMIKTSLLAIYGTGLIMALPIGLLCGFAEPLLTLWAGGAYARLAPLLWVMVFPLAANLAVTPLFAVSRAVNAPKQPSLATFLAGFASITLAAWSSASTDWGVYGIAGSVAVVLSVRNLVYMPLFTAAVLNIGAGIFIRELFPGLAGAAAVVTVVLAARRIWEVSTWGELIGVSLLISGLYLGITAVQFYKRFKDVSADDGIKLIHCPN